MNQHIGDIITQPINRRKKMERTKKKWIDDFSLFASIDLKKTLLANTEPVRPVPYRSRTEQILPRKDNILQDEVDSVIKLSVDRKMLLNPLKTKAMIFNTLRNHDVLPQIATGDGSNIEVVEEQKILGFILRSDLKTISNTEYICKRAYQRMWVIRRLKSLGCPIPELLDVLRQQIISICEGSVAYWGPMITKSESNMLERCLKTGLHIIYQDRYLSFSNALQLAKMKSLKVRRVEHITRFSKKAYQSEKYKHWFCKSEEPAGMATRRRQAPVLKPVQCRTQRYSRSSIPVMTKLLNWHPPLRYVALDLA